MFVLCAYHHTFFGTLVMGSASYEPIWERCSNVVMILKGYSSRTPSFGVYKSSQHIGRRDRNAVGDGIHLAHI